MTTATDNRRAAHFRNLAHMSKREAMVVRALELIGPATPSEIAAHVGLDVTMVRPRCCEMAKPERAALAEVGERLNKYGNPETVYAIARQGVLL